MKVSANRFLDNVYGFELGLVLFKPTLSGGAETFRPTKEGALSYFVGHDPKYPSDNGFGIQSIRNFHGVTKHVYGLLIVLFVQFQIMKKKRLIL